MKNKLSLMLLFILLAMTNPAIADDVNQQVDFKYFTEMKSAARKAGEVIGAVQACEDANGFISSVRSSDLISYYSDVLSGANLNFDMASALDDELNNSASTARKSIEQWSNRATELSAVTGCGFDVCCNVYAVADDYKIMERRSGWVKEKTPENARDILSYWMKFSF